MFFFCPGLFGATTFGACGYVHIASATPVQVTTSDEKSTETWVCVCFWLRLYTPLSL